MAETLQLGTETRIVDPKTGQLTRQGVLLFQSLTELPGEVNDHVATAATEDALGHVKKADFVADPSSSTVSVDFTDIAAAGGSYNQTYTQGMADAINELKADVNTLKTDVNALVTIVTALMHAMQTAGQQSTS